MTLWPLGEGRQESTLAATPSRQRQTWSSRIVSRDVNSKMSIERESRAEREMLKERRGQSTTGENLRATGLSCQLDCHVNFWLSTVNRNAKLVTPCKKKAWRSRANWMIPYWGLLTDWDGYKRGDTGMLRCIKIYIWTNFQRNRKYSTSQVGVAIVVKASSSSISHQGFTHFVKITIELQKKIQKGC